MQLTPKIDRSAFIKMQLTGAIKATAAGQHFRALQSYYTVLKLADSDHELATIAYNGLVSSYAKFLESKPPRTTCLPSQIERLASRARKEAENIFAWGPASHTRTRDAIETAKGEAQLTRYKLREEAFSYAAAHVHEYQTISEENLTDDLFSQYPKFNIDECREIAHKAREYMLNQLRKLNNGKPKNQNKS